MLYRIFYEKKAFFHIKIKIKLNCETEHNKNDDFLDFYQNKEEFLLWIKFPIIYPFFMNKDILLLGRSLLK